jgi:hypothetical protein
MCKLNVTKMRIYIMDKLIITAAFSLATFFSSTVNAAVVEFDTSNLLMEDLVGSSGFGLYNPTGTFTFDTETLSVDFVSVSTPNANYIDGVYDDTFEAFGLFTSSGVNGLVLDITIDFAELEFEIAGLSAGDEFFIGADPFEFDNSNGDSYGSPVDPGLQGTVLSTVPLPASLPLFLAGLGTLAFIRRWSRTA